MSSSDPSAPAPAGAPAPASAPHPEPTARIAFRCWTPEDMPLARALFGDARVTELVGGPFGEAAIAARLATELDNQREHRIAYWPIRLHTGEAIGCCGLKPRDPATRIVELGFYLLPPYWGQGLAAEAGASAVAYAFGPLGAPELFAGHHPENHGSRATLLKLGFRYTHHELYPPTGLEHPCYTLPRP